MLCSFSQAEAIKEDIGYPSFIKDPKELAARVKDVSSTLRNAVARVLRGLTVNRQKRNIFTVK